MDTKTVITSAIVSALISIPTVAGFVSLQDATPGTAEVGHINISGTVRAAKLDAITATGTAIRGENTAATGATSGGEFRSASSTGWGVLGVATASSGLAAGGRFENRSSIGRGVHGVSVAASGINYGGYFSSISDSGRGVCGSVSALTGNTYGGEFESSSTTGRGVRGYASATTGSNYGGQFQTNSSGGRGVLGSAIATSGVTHGGQFYAISPGARGVAGYASALTGTTYGVHGTANSPNGYGLWAQGRSGASGTKSFRIDHPADPENQYLMHYSAEGPEPLNIYRGTAITDAKGEAWITLPDYYEEINTDPSYQLTVIENQDTDQFVQAKVAIKIKQSRFKIRTNAPRIEVCWEVKARRDDLWVRKYGAPVEVDKGNFERGKYQHPELYGKPSSMGMTPDPSKAEDIKSRMVPN